MSSSNAQVERRSTMADFIVAQKLGSGSYGNVYKVQRKADKQHYAIKEVNIRKLQPREREDAVNEIRILASIKHKNIVRYCDAFIEKDNLYIVMEFAEHGDISRQIEKFKKANKYIKEDTIWSYAIQICLGLQAMHNRNVLHRDIKAKNIFLTGKNHVRLGDLGCAKLMKAGMARTQIGTPYYMSPEIWANKPYDVKSDIWAVGCLLYELAMLAPPFVANDMNGLALKIKTTTAPRISKHYSEDLANLIASMLKPDPKARPTVDQILTSTAVTTRMSAVPVDDEGAWIGEEMRSHMIATIKVPYGFGYGGPMKQGNGGLNLPAPCYPQSRPSSPKANDNNNSNASVPVNNNNVQGNALPSSGVPQPLLSNPSVVAAQQQQQQPSNPPPSAPSSDLANKNFAACTSPPHLGRPNNNNNNNNLLSKENNHVVGGGGMKPMVNNHNSNPAAVVIAKRPLSAAVGNLVNNNIPKMNNNYGNVPGMMMNKAVPAPIVGGNIIPRPGVGGNVPGIAGKLGLPQPSLAAPDLRNKQQPPLPYSNNNVGIPSGNVVAAKYAAFGGVGVGNVGGIARYGGIGVGVGGVRPGAGRPW